MEERGQRNPGWRVAGVICVVSLCFVCVTGMCVCPLLRACYGGVRAVKSWSESCRCVICMCVLCARADALMAKELTHSQTFPHSFIHAVCVPQHHTRHGLCGLREVQNARQAQHPGHRVCDEGVIVCVLCVWCVSVLHIHSEISAHPPTSKWLLCSLSSHSQVLFSVPPPSPGTSTTACADPGLNLDRNEVIALINLLAKLSKSVEAIRELSLALQDAQQ